MALYRELHKMKHISNAYIFCIQALDKFFKGLDNSFLITSPIIFTNIFKIK